MYDQIKIHSNTIEMLSHQLFLFRDIVILQIKPQIREKMQSGFSNKLSVDYSEIEKISCSSKIAKLKTIKQCLPMDLAESDMPASFSCDMHHIHYLQLLVWHCLLYLSPDCFQAAWLYIEKSQKCITIGITRFQCL